MTHHRTPTRIPASSDSSRVPAYHLLRNRTATDLAVPLVAVAASSTPHTLVLAVTGEIDLSSASIYQQALNRAMTHAAHADLVVLDLRRVAFCGAAGLRVLLAAAQACERRDATFTVVVEPDGQLDRVIVLAGLHDRLPMSGTPQSAMDAHRRSPTSTNTTTRGHAHVCDHGERVPPPRP